MRYELDKLNSSINARLVEAYASAYLLLGKDSQNKEVKLEKKN